jgi:predicted deacylase
MIECPENYFFYDDLSCQRDFLNKAGQLLSGRQGRLDRWFIDSSLNASINASLNGSLNGPVQSTADASLDARLSCDSLWIGDEAAKTVWVFISGTHGVEGYCGSAAQRFLLDHLLHDKVSLPASCALLFIHALNPWGMHWARRCDHQGIDINRNFIDFKHIPAASSDYEKVLECLLLRTAEQRSCALAVLREAWGQAHFDRVFSGGQYQQPWAPFYGGQAPAFSHHIVEQIIQTYVLTERKVSVIDIHSGLGPWAYGQLISDHFAESESNVWARQLFADWVAVTEMGESFSVPKAGLLDYRWHRLMNAGKTFFLTLEFGTLGSDSLFSVLLDEHLYWKDRLVVPNADDKGYQNQRQAMLDHFCPDNAQWQQAVLFQTRQVFDLLSNSVE